jgi:signal transduction histidine kinase
MRYTHALTVWRRLRFWGAADRPVISAIQDLLGMMAVVILLAWGISEGETVRIGLYENPPKVHIDKTGTPCGIFIDIIEYIARNENWEIEYVNGTWDEGLTRLENDSIDLMPDVAYSDIRAQRFDFNRLTVLSSWLQAYSRKDCFVESVADLDGKKIAVLKGGIQERICMDIRKVFDLQFDLLTRPDYDATIEAVESGEADVVVVGRFYAFGRKSKTVLPTPVLLNPSTLHFAANKGRNQDLLAAIDKHLAAMQNDGHSVYYQSLVSWLHEKPRFFVPGYVVWIIVAVSIGALLLFAVSLVLRWQVRERTRELDEKNRQLFNALQELKNAQQEALQRERLYAFGQLASGIAHDFNNLLAPILTYSELLIKMPADSKNEEETKQKLKNIFNAALHGRELLHRMQKFYRGAKHTEPVQLIDMSNIAREVVELARTRWSKLADPSAADIKVDLRLGTNITIKGKKSVAHEVLLNLVLNAADAMPNGGNLEISVESLGDSIRVTVKDSGVGMTEEVRQKCMEPFFTTKGTEGTGMGLSMVKNIVMEQGGRIDIQSSIGQGTIFIITLPRAPDHAKQESS